MPEISSAAVAERYHRDGFVFPLKAMEPAEALRYRQQLEAYEGAAGGPISALAPRTKHKMKAYLRSRWAFELGSNPRILDAIEQIIGPNILLLHTVFFIKEPRTTQIAAWHQDSVYFGLEPVGFPTAWVALSPATEQSGFMKFAPGSFALGDVEHMRGYAGSVNTLAQSVTMKVDESTAVQASLQPGEFSLHHCRTLHYSGPNHSDDRRIGISHVYVPTHARCTGTMQRSAILVRGVDEYHNFTHERPPLSDDDPAAEIEHERACAVFRACHDEQVKWHEAGLDRYGRSHPTASP